jgi:hypothetical protein
VVYNLLITVLYVFTAFVLTFLIGHTICEFALIFTKKSHKKLKEIIPFSVGLLSFFLLDSTYGRFIGGVKQANIIFNLASVTFTFLFLMYRLYKSREDTFEILRKYTSSSLLITAVVVWIFLIPIFSDSRKGVLLGITSLGNNDLPLYSQLSMHNLIYGFHGQGQISPIVGTLTAGEYLSNFTYIGTIAAIDHFGTLFNLNVIQATSLTLMFSVGFVFMSLRHLGHSLGLNSKIYNPLAVIGLLLPVSLYSISMGFIGALFGIAAFVIMTSCSLSLAKNHMSRDEFVLTMAMGLSIAIFTYSQIALPILIALLFIHLLRNYILKVSNLKVKLLINYGAAGTIGALLSLNALPNLITLTKWLSGDGFGWKLQLFDPISIFLSTAHISFSQSKTYLLLWIPIFVYVLHSFLVLLREKSDPHETLLLSALLVSPVLFISNYGSSGYQVWKYITYISPVFVILLLSQLKKNVLIIYLYACFTFLLPVILWQPILGLTAPQTTSKGMYDIANYVNSKPIKSININVGEYWPSMLVGSLLERKEVALNDTTYAPVKIIPDTCTVVDNKNEFYNSKFTVYANSEYAVVNFPTKCS